jgi:purine-binding chemotaxis protein CheW
MSDQRRFLLLQTGKQSYALPFEQVTEVSELRSLTLVPRAPLWCIGAIRSAGVVVAVVDLAWYLGEGPEQQPEKLVVLDLRLGGLALQVRQVAAVLLEDPVKLEKDASGMWLLTPDTKAELLDGAALVQEISAALSR